MSNRIVSRSLMGALCSACFTTASAQERPNIIVFLVDDMGLMDTSVPFVTDENGNAQRQPLNDWYRTPNMERLANQGIRFSTFYAQSVRKATTALHTDHSIGIGKGSLIRI